ncbi:MAG: 4Fe-4S dicluster domain-containing protein [Alphaproteobacteria bacterium]|nr:4Fe-4S dicluster domain-containing protein [Alphaproteobacteria bacterium]
MSAAAPAKRNYDLGFARWVYQNVEGGDRLSLCMQCGMCSGSCPIGAKMDQGPRKLFMMIRAGMKDAVLTSDTLWNCTQCYNCVVRCPRQIKVTNILQGLARVAVAEGYVTERPTARFAKAFWRSLRMFGRTDERIVTALFYFSSGLKAGIDLGLKNLPIAQRMIKAGRMHLGLPHRAKGAAELRAILDKAAAIEKGEGAKP